MRLNLAVAAIYVAVQVAACSIASRDLTDTPACLNASEIFVRIGHELMTDDMLIYLRDRCLMGSHDDCFAWCDAARKPYARLYAAVLRYHSVCPEGMSEAQAGFVSQSIFSLDDACKRRDLAAVLERVERWPRL